jgi:hypothetical protein
MQRQHQPPGSTLGGRAAPFKDKAVKRTTPNASLFFILDKKRPFQNRISNSHDQVTEVMDGRMVGAAILNRPIAEDRIETDTRLQSFEESIAHA